MSTRPLVNLSNLQIMNLQILQKKTLRFAFDERYPYTRNTKTLQEIAALNPINYNLYCRANTIIETLGNVETQQFTYLRENYGDELDHQWFQITRNIIARGIPRKKYTR